MTDLAIASVPSSTPQAGSPDEAEQQAVPPHVSFDLTRKCPAVCGHCYNQSGPTGDDGEMTLADWLSALNQCAELGARSVQFIGGEPMLYRGLDTLINRALERGLAVEVFSALMFVPEHMWPVLQQKGVMLATSYYSDLADEHEAITNNRGSYKRTRSNIERALKYGIPLRAGIIEVREGQRVVEAAAELRALGVTQIGTDRVRALGRADADRTADTASQLCGHCTRGRAAILPSGEVTGCPMSADVGSVGNVRTAPLRDIVSAPDWADLAAMIPPPSSARSCYPKQDTCDPSSTPGVVPVGIPLSSGGCTPDEDSCAPSPGAFPANSLAAAEACVPALDGSCYPKQDTCDPSSTSGTVPVSIPLLAEEA